MVILETLDKAKRALRGLETKALRAEPGFEDWQKYFRDTLGAAADEIGRQRAVAAVTLGEQAAAVLKQLDEEEQSAAGEDDLWTYLDRRRAAVEKAYEEIVRLAKKDRG